MPRKTTKKPQQKPKQKTDGIWSRCWELWCDKKRWHSLHLLFVTLCAVTLLASVFGLMVFEHDKNAEPSGQQAYLAKEFAKSENLPKAQIDNMLLTAAYKDVLIFQVLFGEANDCPAGCFYSKAVGIAYKDNIGWLHVENYVAESGALNFTYYDFKPDETRLFSPAFGMALQEKDDKVRDGYLRLLAQDKDTPLYLLSDIVGQVREGRQDACVVLDLSKNETVKAKIQLNEAVTKLYSQNLKDDYIADYLYADNNCLEI